MTTNNQKKTKYEFTGGDNLTGLYQLYHELMMRNELEEEKGAYKVTYAGESQHTAFSFKVEGLFLVKKHINVDEKEELKKSDDKRLSFALG